MEVVLSSTYLEACCGKYATFLLEIPMHLEIWVEMDHSSHQERSCEEELGPRWLIGSWSDSSSAIWPGPGE